MRKTLFLLFITASLALQGLAQTQDTAVVNGKQLQEVVVSATGAERRLQSVQIGAEQVVVKELTQAPALFGEADIMRALQLLPGVKSESDASSSFQVRGGTSAQNNILYDGTPVYNVGHAGGLFSAFNDEALSTAVLYKGLIPAQRGGATAAVLDIATRTGRRDRWGGSVGVGLLSAKAAIEGPVVKDRLNMLLTARRSYVDMLLKAVPDFKGNTLYFYDANLKMDYTIDSRNQLFLSAFVSHDRTALEDAADIRWTNMAASMSWLHTVGRRSSWQTSLMASSYDTDNGIDLLGMNIAYSGHIRHAGLRQTFRIAAGSHELNVGGECLLNVVKSAEWQRVSNHEREERRALSSALWAGWQHDFASRLTVQAGVRLSAFSALGGPYYYDIDDKGNITWMYKRRSGRPVKTYYSVEPRLSMAWRVSPTMTVKTGYTRSSQNIHALRNQSTQTPFDRYTISTNLLKPETADQLSVGLYGMTPDGSYDWSAEAYYRSVDGVLDYRDGVSFASAIEIERLVKAGRGRSYGIETALRKNSGRLTGSISYTLAWSRNKIDGINGSRWYDANNDRRHDVNIVVQYRLTDDWLIGASWVFNSGQAFTAPSAKYQMIDNYIYYYSERNGYRAPDYHHLDLNATWTRKICGGQITREWTFGIYNVYNRYNPFLIRFKDSQYGKGTKATQISLFGIVPSVALTLTY